MRTWFAIPEFDDQYQTFTFRVLHYTLLLLIALVLIFLPFATSPAQLIFIPFILALLVLCYYLLHTHHYHLAGGLFLGGFWTIITFASFSLNGIRNSSYTTYALVIIFAAILFSNRVVVLFTTLSILSGVILTLGEMNQILPLRMTDLFLADRFFQSLALFGSAGILLSAASQVIRTGFARIRQHEQTLLERNRELENEIIERQRIEATLRASEEKYRILFENIGAMAAVYDRDGTIVLMNHFAARLFETTPEAVLGRTLYDLVFQEDAAHVIQLQARVMDTGIAEINEGKLVLPSGKEFYYLRHVMPLPHPGGTGQASQVLVITADITRQKLAEQRERELILVQEKNAFLTDFLSTVSHDLKTPLAVINTSLFLLERIQNPDSQRQRIEQIKNQVLMLDKYIQDMLTISRLEHLPTLNLEAINLNSLIEEVVGSLKPRSEKKNIECRLNIQNDMTPMIADQEQMRRVLVNLVENAINYTPANGRVIVSAYRQNEQVLIEVADTGIGIKLEDQTRIFERFYRAPEGRAVESNGTGLGLAIVKKIIDMHQGTIELESQPGQGAAFRISLPVSPELSGKE